VAAYRGPDVPFVRLDNAEPELLAQLLGAVERVARKAAFTLGEEGERFEAEFAAFCGVEHAIGVSSGTEALTLVLRALGVGPDDEVILPANSFIATAEAVSLAGARPRLVDVDPHTALLTAPIVERALSARTRCVIPVHLYGRTVDLDPILAVAGRAGVPVVEDACQAHGARYRGRAVGSLGRAGCFSFYPTKNLGGWGDGGAVVTDDADVAERVRLLRSHGEARRHDHRVRGTTGRLDAIQAAVLRIKLGRLEESNRQRRRAAAALRAELNAAGVGLPHPPAPDGDHVFHLFVVLARDREALRAVLASRGVSSGVHYPVPIHLTPAYADLGLGPGSLPVAEGLARRVCSLPLFAGMGEDEVQRVAAAVREADRVFDLSSPGSVFSV
jgi:dTDP-3-amino-3,4,6-trideoxy-alpha-D-glucose transaminase